MSKRINWSINGSQAWSHSLGALYQLTEIERKTIDADPKDSGGSFYMGGNRYMSIQFPEETTIEEVQFMFDPNVATGPLVIQVSSNSTDGIDNDWTQVSSQSFSDNTYTTHVITTPTPGTWIRFYVWQDIGQNHYRRLLLFGTQTAPSFEFWDVNETGKLTDDYQLLDDAPNSAAYSDFHSFKIKNTNSDTLAHSYAVSIVALKYPSDTIVTNYLRLAENTGTVESPIWSKSTSITITNLANGSFSEELRVYADLTAEQNPADGFHYWYVRVEETA